MSIEITGPQGYEYQYLVSAFILINYLHYKIAPFKFHIEPNNGEDAKLEIDANYICEIQVKKESKDLDLKTLVKWLNHFPSQQGTNNLLARLKDNTNIKALFVTSKRCKDSCSSLISNFSLDKHIITKELIDCNTFIAEQKKYKSDNKKGKLKEDREFFAKQLADEFNANNKILKEILSRVVIWETINKDILVRQTKEILNKKWRIRDSAVDEILLKILEIIRNCRDNGENTTEQIINLLNHKFATNKIFNETIVVERKELEDKLKSDFEKNNVLLLTGISQCGKTFLAQKIADSYQQKGYYARIFDNISEAKRFLESDIEEKRLCLLGDPFGHVQLADSYILIRTQINDLLTNHISSSRMLIITSRIDLLSRIYKQNDMKIKNIEWESIDQYYDKDFAFKLIDCHNLTDELKALAKNVLEYGLSIDGMLIQVGQLKHLLNNITNEQTRDLNKLLSYAKHDAHQIGEILAERNPETKRIMLVLTLLCNTTIAVNLKDLCFVLSDNAELPSLDTTEDLGYNLFERFKEKATYPKYQHKYDIEDTFSNVLDFLEKHGYIKYDDIENITFSHPNYLEAGLYIVKNSERNSIKTLLKLFEKGVFCASHKNAALCARNISYLYSLSKLNTEKKQFIIDLAMKCLANSRFPRVKDEALIFLIKNISTIKQNDEQQYETLKNEIESYHNDIDFVWFDGDVCYNLKDNRDGFSQYNSYSLDIKQITLNIDKLLNDKLITLTTEENWNICQYLSDQNSVSDQDKKKIYFKLLSNELSFIREVAVFNYLKYFISTDNDLALIQNIFSDNHPAVIKKAIQGILEGVNCVKYIEIVNDSAKSSLTKIENAFISYHIIFELENQIMHGEHEPQYYLYPLNNDYCYKLWAELFPVVISTISEENYMFDTTRLAYTIEEAVKYLDFDKVEELFIVYIEKIIKPILLDGGKSDEDLFWFINVLFEKTTGNAKQRKMIFVILVKIRHTYFTGIFIKKCFQFWDYLSANEQGQIENVIFNREDNLLLQAISTTRSDIPLLVKQKINKNQHPVFLKEDFYDPLVFEIAIDMICASNSRYYPFSENYNIKWHKTLENLLNDSNISIELFKKISKKVIYHIITNSLNGFSDNIEQKFFQINDHNKVLIIIDNIIYWRCNLTGFVCDFVKNYICNLKEDKYEYAISKIVENIELINIREQISRVFTPSIINDIFNRKEMYADRCVLTGLKYAVLSDAALEALIKIIELCPLKLFTSIDRLISVVNDNFPEHKLLEVLKKNRNDYFKKSSEYRENRAEENSISCIWLNEIRSQIL